ncbi:nitrate- and nitrite sensing domain-containing protein [Streptomyces echinoruber]|uniref:histidine kinase n=1 Tax=Streptomyces echinoruber TaxID=68898 RepID=A0A918QX19_9ACTN|nr:nitrate- and nitrite sensing domain-containing protein [Streptomyces echinoruber]GGZ76262.1 histidine kinase [Streptomyces echinoruber]
MQKTRPRRTGKQAASPAGAERTSDTSTPTTPDVGKGRPTHVRNRLIAAVAVVAAAIAGAGAPSVLAASRQLGDSQDLVTLAERTGDALALAHSLADERDEVTAYIAAGRPKSKAPDEQQSTRVDRQVEELRGDPDIPAWLRSDLDGVGAVRRAALTGRSSALQAHQAYSAAITDLHRLAEELAEKMPARAGAGAHALAELDTAVQQAAAARGLLLAALSVPHAAQSAVDPVTGLPTASASSGAGAKQRDALSAAAQQARLRSDAALADFRDTAPAAAKASYDSTVTGPEVEAADKYLAALTDQPTLSAGDLNTSTGKVGDALSARVDAMRGVEAALYDRRAKDLAKLRDDDVTALEIRVAVLGALLLVAVGVTTALARSLTRPLSVLRRGSARLAGAEDLTAQEPVRFTGRNDEFAQVVRNVNALHAQAVALAERVATLEADRKHLVGQRQKMADAREELRAELDRAGERLETMRRSIGGTFVNLALRTLGLVERQLTVIEGMEEREQDPERLSTLFKLDHFATVMRRHSENLLVLAGSEHVQQHAGPVPLVDVVRAAVSEIERYERVRITALPPHTHVAGFAADDLSHLLAELMENATAFSPPEQPVEVSGWLLENGEVMLSVQDEGIGMTAERMSRLNARLADFDPEAPYDHGGDDGLGLGLYVVARLAHRHGLRVQLREQKQGGIAAVVVLPKALLAAPPAAAPAAAPASDGTHGFSLPGADAEANSNVLRGRTAGGDPLVAAAERAVQRAEKDAAAKTEAAEAGPAPAAEAASRAADRPERTAPSAPVPAPAPAPKAAPRSGGAAEHPAETTMELLLPQPPAEPAESAAPAAGPGTEPEAATAGAPAPESRSGHAAAPAGRTASGTGTSSPYSIGPDSHERAPDEGGDTGETEETEETEEQVTAKGLPKRTPKIAAPAAAPRPRTGSVDAEALRRRLGGFRRGAEAGYRRVEAEIAERTGQNARPATGPAHAEETTGGTVEEASS